LRTISSKRIQNIAVKAHLRPLPRHGQAGEQIPEPEPG
jgi:hypothetical protein